MSLFYKVINWILAVSEIFMCYCFVSLLDDWDFVRKNKIYVSIWSMGIGSILAFNRSVTTLISWLMLLIQSVFVLVSLMFQKRKNTFLKFSIILICSICCAFLQLLGTFGIIILFPQIHIKQVYHMQGLAFFSCCVFALGVMYIFYRIIEKRIRKKTINLKPFCLSLYIYDMAGICLIILFQRQLLIYEKNQSVDILFFLMMFITVLILTLIGSIKNAETKSELEILEFKDKILEDNYKEIHSIYQNYAYTYHDMKNHLIILDNYCKNLKVVK